MKKILLAVVLLAGCGGAVRGQVVGTANEPEVKSLFNFGSFFSSVRAGYAINQHLEKSEIYYTAVQSFHDLQGVELVNINVGYNGAKKRPLFAAGVRFDNIVPMIWGSQWGRKHVSTAKLPSLEFGPFISGWPIKTTNGYRVDVQFGLAIAVGFAN